jgi:hypothetical protein
LLIDSNEDYQSANLISDTKKININTSLNLVNSNNTNNNLNSKARVSNSNLNSNTLNNKSERKRNIWDDEDDDF